MNTIVEHINSVGHTFVEFALPMLIQSSVLIAILLLVDLLLRKKVKAVFRYWIWMLVLLKLILPTSLSSPLSLGYLFGDKLTYQDLAETTSALELAEPAPAESLPGINPLYIQPNLYVPPKVPVTSVVEPVIAGAVSPPAAPVTPLSWQGIVFLVWLAVVIAMGLLLLQRALFVRGLVAQAKKASRLMNDDLAYCCASMRIKCKVGLKVSPNATTPSVCGLIRPVILVPWNLVSTLGVSRMRTILVHELAHIRRADLWVNLAQTILQIIYFYNPQLWVANFVIRRIREQAVDEAVLVAMGGKAQQYPQMLVDVAKMAFKRPALSLRLIGVVESKNALAGRIKHILGRPMPKSAKLGIIGLLAVIIAGAILLPMAKAKDEDRFSEKDLLIKFAELPEGEAKKVSVDDTTIWSKSYEVEFAPEQDLLVAVEMYQAGKPMRIIGRNIFEGSEKPEKFTVTFDRTYQDAAKRSVTHNIQFKLGHQVFKIPVHTPRYLSTQWWDWYRGEGLRRPEMRYTKTRYAGIETLFYYGAANLSMESEYKAKFWIPGRDVTPAMNQYGIALKMIPLSSLKYLYVEPIGGYQGLDGKIISRSLTLEKADQIADEYKQMIIDSVEKQWTPEKQADMETDVQVEVEKTPQTVFTATLPNGVTVELVGLCEEPVGGAKWWKPDGRYMPEPFFKANKRTPPSKGMTTQYTFLAKAEGSEDISIKMKIYEGFGWSTQVAEDGTALCYIKHRNDAKPYHKDAFSQGPIEVGVAQGQWIKGRGVSSPNIQIPRSYSIGSHDEIVIQPPRPEKNSPEMATIFWFTSSSHDYEYRLICTLKDGSVEECMKPFFQSTNKIEAGNLKNSTLNTKSFNIDRPLEQIVNYELLYRKFDYARFNNVAFKPNAKTAVQFEVGGPTKEDAVSNPPQPELLSTTPPIFAYDTKLNFADPTVRDGSFHSKQSMAFCLSFHNIEIPPADKILMDHLLIGQTTWPVHLEDNGITINEGVAGQKVLSLTWPAGEPKFEKVIKIPVKYGQKEYSCPVRVELDRRDKEAPTGSYWFCAYLSGRLPWGAGGRGFEIVNLDQQMEFRLTGDGTDPRDAVLGIDIDGDGKIDPAKTGGEQFDLYEPFQIGAKTYRLTEVDPYLPRVVFRELVSENSLKLPAKTAVPVGIKSDSTVQAVPLKAFEFKLVEKLLSLVKQIEKEYPEQATHWPAGAGLYHIDAQGRVTVWHYRSLWQRSTDCAPDEVGWGSSQLVNAVGMYYLPDGTPLQSRWRERGGGMKDIRIQVGREVGENERVPIIHRHRLPGGHDLLSRDGLERKIMLDSWKDLPLAIIVRVDRPMRLDGWWLGDVKTDIQHFNEYDQLIVKGSPGNNNKPMLVTVGLPETDVQVEVEKIPQNVFTTTLPNGVTVELMGVCELPSEGKQWWAADGSLLEDIFWEGSTANRESSVDARQVVFRIRSDESAPAPTISFEPKRRLQPPGSWSGAFFVHKDNQTLEELRGCSFSLHDDQKSIDISADIGYGPWKTLTKLAMNSEISLPKPVFTDIGYLTWNEPTEEGGKTTVSATMFDAVKVWRIVAVDKQDDIHTSSTAFGQGFDGHQIVKATFSLPLSRIEKFRFQTRPFGEITFKNVSLEPNFKTDVQIKVEGVEPVLVDEIEAARAVISLPVRKIFSGKTDKGGSFEWETSIDPRVRFRHGWCFFEDGVLKGYVGAGASRNPEEGRINLKLDVEVKDNMLNLKVQRVHDLDDGSRTAAVAGKTSVPSGAYLKHVNSIDSAVLTNKHLILWQGDFIRDGKVVKSVIYAAYLTTPDDQETGFKPPELQNGETVTPKIRPDVQIGVESNVSPKLVMLLGAINSCAAETKLNIDSISITARNISIKGDTSSRTYTLKFLDAIKKNELEVLQFNFARADNRDKFSIIIEPAENWQQWFQQRKTDVQLGLEETVSLKLVMLLAAINSCAAETDLNIESISVSAKSMSIEGNTSGRTDTLKFLDAIKENGLEVLRLSDIARDNRNKFSLVVEPKKNWQQWWQQHKTTVPVDVGVKGAASESAKSHRNRYFVTLLVTDGGVIFRGKKLTWDQLEDSLKNTPDRGITVLEVAVDPAILPADLRRGDQPGWISDNVEMDRAGELAKELGFEGFSDIGVDRVGARRGPISVRFEEAFRLGEEIPVALESFEARPLSRTKSIEFSSTRTIVRATLKVSVISYPRKSWEIEVRLLDDQGEQIISTVETLRNTGIVISGGAFQTQQEIGFSFAQAENAVNAARFEVKMREFTTSRAAGKPDVRTKVESPGERAALIWGEPVNGLRAAVEFVPEKSSYSPGERIEVRFYVENVSERTIQIARIEGQTDPGNWIIEDPNQTRISVGRTRWMGARRIDRRVLKPGQTAVLELEPLTIVESRTSRKGRVQAVVNGPGTYTARYRLNLTPRAEGDWSGALETAQRKLVVTAASGPDQLSDVPVGIKSDSTVQAVPLKAFEFKLVEKLLDLVKQVEKQYPRQATHWPAGAGLYHIDAQGRVTVWHYRSLWQRSTDCAPDEVGWGSSQLVNAVGMYYLPDGTPLQSRWRERGGGMKDIRIQVGREVGENEHVPVIHRHRLSNGHDLLSRDGLERNILLDSWKDLPLAIIVRVDKPMRLAGWWLGDVKTDIQHFNEYDQLIVNGPLGSNKPMLVTVGLPETNVPVEGGKRQRRVRDMFHTYVTGKTITEEDTTTTDGIPNYVWSDIPTLLELAESDKVLRAMPSLSISSYIQKQGVEGMIALWLVEGLRRKQVQLMREKQTRQYTGPRTYYLLPLNPICVRESSDRAELVMSEKSPRIHREVLQAYRRWWQHVGPRPPEEAAAFCPLDLTDIGWYGWQRWEHRGPLEMYKKVSSTGAVAERIIRALEYHAEDSEYRPGRKIRTIYYTLKDESSPAEKRRILSTKRPFSKEMLAVQKVVLYFYDRAGMEIRFKKILVAGRPGQEMAAEQPIEKTDVQVEVEGTGEKNALAWGEEVDGLQLGLSYDSAERPYCQGEIVSFDVHARNNSNKAVDLSYVELFHWCPYARDVTDVNDAISIVNARLIRGDASAQEEHISLGPGDRQSLGKVALQIGPLPKGAQRAKYSADLEPGGHIVTQTGTFGGIGYDSWRGKLTTGELPLIVLPAQTRIGPPKTRGGISGVVVSSVTGEPIAGAYVGVGDFGDSGGSNYSRHREQGFHDKTKTDANGWFELDGLAFTDDHPYLKYHPLVVTHPDFVRHDEKVELLKDKPVPDVKVSLRPAAKINVTIVDAEGNHLKGHWLIRLEALDGRRFIPPGSDPHLSSFASSIWAHMPDLRARMGVSNGFTFTELDTGEYSIEAIKFHLVDKPTPQNVWKPTITYHGSIPNLKIEAGRTKEVRIKPADYQTSVSINMPEDPVKKPQIPPFVLISRNTGLLLWNDGKAHGPEDHRLGRLQKNAFFYTSARDEDVFTIENLPPGSYSVFAGPIYFMSATRVEVSRGREVVVDMPPIQITEHAKVGLWTFNRKVKLQARDYSVSELCEILTDITESNPRIIAGPSIENEKLSFGRGEMSVWDVLEKLYLDKGWRVEEDQDKTLIIRPAEV